MTTREFSNTFDTLLNSYGTQAGLGSAITLDEYEKSLFLTLAQEQLVIELYTGKGPGFSSFEKTEELRSNLRSLVRTAVLTESKDNFKGLSKYSKFFTLPPDTLYITYETATLSDDKAGCNDGSEVLITPVTQDEFSRLMNNPFKQPSKRRALRLDSGKDTVEIVSKYNIKDYTIRYLSKPTPIILTDLEGVKINEEDKVTECKLDSSVHLYILEKAVTLAIASMGAQSKSNV